MARGNELMDEIREELRANREERAGLNEERVSFKEFIHEQTLRMERAAEHQGSELAKIGQVMERVIEHLDDMRDQVRASTEATWRMLDRLDGNGGPAAA